MASIWGGRPGGAMVLAWLTIAVASAAIVGYAQAPRPVRRESATAEQQTLHRREGDEFRGLGEFAFTGDRITFYPAESDEVIRTLENLSLERISNMLEETRGRGQWEVEGTITEFRGQNYLLVKRAVLKAKENFEPNLGF